MPLSLSRNQQLFAAALAQGTGLNPYVVEGWMINEEPQGAQSTVGQNDQNWLNIGNVDSGARLGHGDSIWSNPVAAGRATAEWLKGNPSVAGYGVASPGIQAITRSAGQGAGAQIAAIQHSGWATSGEPSLPGLYSQASGGPTPVIPKGYKAPAGSMTSTPGSSTTNVKNVSLGPLGTVQPVKAQLVGQGTTNSGPKESDLLGMFGTQDSKSDPGAACVWNAMAGLLRTQGR